jgi:phosphonate transport system permease protein
MQPPGAEDEMELVAVAAIDWISGKLRFAIIGQRAVA